MRTSTCFPSPLLSTYPLGFVDFFLFISCYVFLILFFVIRGRVDRKHLATHWLETQGCTIRYCSHISRNNIIPPFAVQSYVGTPLDFNFGIH